MRGVLSTWNYIKLTPLFGRQSYHTPIRNSSSVVYVFVDLADYLIFIQFRLYLIILRLLIIVALLLLA